MGNRCDARLHASWNARQAQGGMPAGQITGSAAQASLEALSRQSCTCSCCAYVMRALCMTQLPRSQLVRAVSCRAPESAKLRLKSSYSFTLRPASMSCMAFSPRTVTYAEIFSFLRMPNRRTVYRALPYTGCCPVNCSSTYKACIYVASRAENSKLRMPCVLDSNTCLPAMQVFSNFKHCRCCSA